MGRGQSSVGWGFGLTSGIILALLAFFVVVPLLFMLGCMGMCAGMLGVTGAAVQQAEINLQENGTTITSEAAAVEPMPEPEPTIDIPEPIETTETIEAEPMPDPPYAAPPKYELREWIDTTGRFKTNATFVSFGGGQVTIRKADGTTRKLPLDKLSDADREYVRSLR